MYLGGRAETTSGEMREGEKSGLEALVEWELAAFGAGDHISVDVVHVQFGVGARLEDGERLDCDAATV